MYQLSYINYCQFAILTFIIGLLSAMGLWTIGLMLDNGILPLLPVQTVSPKSGPGNGGKVLTSGGADSESGAKSAVHHLDDAGNYLKIYNLSNFKYCLTV
jgi:hypothetical protein